MKKDMIKLAALIIIVGAIIAGIYFIGQSVDNKSKYQHPITKPGAKW